MGKLTQQQLEAHLWGAANILRGRTAGQDYKTYILSLMFFKRLSDQWDYEADEKIRQLEQAGVFPVDWNQPAPDGQGKLIANAVVSALVQHFNGANVNLSNANVQPD